MLVGLVVILASSTLALYINDRTNLGGPELNA